jgi:hypothetical protein
LLVLGLEFGLGLDLVLELGVGFDLGIGFGMELELELGLGLEDLNPLGTLAVLFFSRHNPNSNPNPDPNPLLSLPRFTGLSSMLL